MSTPRDARTALIVDQFPLWLDMVEQVVSRVGIRVVGKVASATAALERLEGLKPDILITEIKMADDEMDGIELVRRARECVPGIKTLVLSMYEDSHHIDAALSAGTDAYVLKTAHPDDITAGIRQAFQHSIYLAGIRVSQAPVPVMPVMDESPGLTRREVEILRLVAEGHSNAQLARMLWVTEQTVKFHLSNIYRKLDVANRTEASRWAQLQGLLETSPAPVLQAAIG